MTVFHQDFKPLFGVLLYMATVHRDLKTMVDCTVPSQWQCSFHCCSGVEKIKLVIEVLISFIISPCIFRYLYFGPKTLFLSKSGLKCR